MPDTSAKPTWAFRYLDGAWRELRNDASEKKKAWVEGAIDALKAAGLLNPTEHELWRRRIETCPGHDDEGGRSWCAYCGRIG